ncbi:hypothetical protein L9F63_021972, partial [Diploptera punctata]
MVGECFYACFLVGRSTWNERCGRRGRCIGGGCRALDTSRSFPIRSVTLCTYENLGVVSDERYQIFHQDIKEFETSA